MNNILSLSILEAGVAFRAGTLTATALAEAQLAQIEALNPKVRAFVAVTADQARKAASQADADFSAGIDRGPMQGIGFAIKDLIDLEGVPTRCGSRHQPNTPAVKSAEAVIDLCAEGAVPLGKVATYDFALVGPSFDGPNLPSTNPWNENHITGGSSSGSAAAVAAGMVRVAIGTDTGGSIRSPACYCGVVGLKPTKGAISLAGVFPLSDDLDHVGPIAATVADAAQMARAIGVKDAVTRIGHSIEGMRIGYARDWFAYDPATHPAVLTAMDQAMSDLSLQGANVILTQMPDYAAMEAAGATILQYQAFALHKETLSHAGYGRQARQSLISGAEVTKAGFEKARIAAAQFKLEVSAILSQYDAVATANVLSVAPPFSEFSDEHAVWTEMRTLPFNMTGHPVLAVPIGFHSGLPMGMQLVAQDHHEAVLCQIGDAFERGTDHSTQRAPV